MQKKRILLVVVILLSAVGLCQAATDELHGTIDVTYLSKWVWRGFTVYGKQSAIQPSIDLDLYGTGFGVSAMGHRANSSGYEASERWDYSLYYGNKLWDTESYATNYRISWVYYNFPQLDDHYMDLQETNLVLSWPKICPAGLVPSYVLVKMWPSSSGSWLGSPKSDGTASGFAHIFMLDYPLQLQSVLPETPAQVINLHSEVVYNDGISPVPGHYVGHDWSNAVFGISTNFDLGNKVTLTPGVYHQITMDKSVNPNKDETWASVSLKYAF